MSDSRMCAITAVISTFERPDACERALRSVLAQTEPALEVLICDDGSRDDTASRFREWEARCDRVRYLRLPANTGTPAAARNLGVAHARGDWVAFLDDDDEWLPHKLALQRAAIATGTADVIATNAERSGGGLYFADTTAMHHPGREQLLASNPIITSSAVVRRPLVRFPEARWMRGIEDYATWLALSDGGGRFLILGEPLVRYEDGGSPRLSRERARVELALARLAWTRAARRPSDVAGLRAALRRTAGAGYVVIEGLAKHDRHRSFSASG